MDDLRNKHLEEQGYFYLKNQPIKQTNKTLKTTKINTLLRSNCMTSKCHYATKKDNVKHDDQKAIPPPGHTMRSLIQ